MAMKGAIYSITAILIVTTFLAITTSSILSLPDHSLRIRTADSFIENIYDDGELALYTSAFRSAISLTEVVYETGDYIPDVGDAFEELMLEGTYEDEEQFLLVNNTIKNWTDRIEERATSSGLIANIEVSNIEVYHADPWAFSVRANFSVYVQDLKEIAYWNSSKIITAEIPIIGFDDPMYIVETSNQFTNTINTSPYDGVFVSGTDTTNVQDHMSEGRYIAFSGAPSYLQRLEGDFSASEFGIESLIDKSALSAVYPVNYDRSNADYVYFQGSSPTVYEFNYLPSSFKLDNQSGHIARYELSALIK